MHIICQDRYFTHYMLPSTCCLLIALDVHMFSHAMYGPGINAQGLAPCALGLGAGLISIMADHICTKGNH